jgi:hypothetical protein
MVKAEEEDDIVTRRLTSFRKWGTAYRRSEEVHRLRLYTPSWIEKELAGAGFEVRSLKGFGRVKFQSGHAGFVAKRAR